MVGVMDCAALQGFSAAKVRVEADIARGIPSFQLVGLVENSVKEARVRVQSAMNNAGFSFPRGKISVNLAPADVHKHGTAFDLAIALAILKASGVISDKELDGVAAIGELSLTGEIRPVRGMLTMADSIKQQGFKTLLVAQENAHEAALIEGLCIKIVKNFGEMMNAIMSNTIDALPTPQQLLERDDQESMPDMSDVVGQHEARRALLIAVSGQHNVILIGGPGSGKSMMAHRMPSIFPPLSYEESIDLTKIYSAAGLTLSGNLIKRRPFRAPHHSITRAGLVGGGSGLIRPGEISLSSYGVLFLDELLEFPRSVLEVLRQPLEDGHITLSRASHAVTFPAHLSLVAALNPCPCGHYGQRTNRCTCSPFTVERYQSKLSGPLMDRIDLCVNVPPVNVQLMSQSASEETSASMREKVMIARAMQMKRFNNHVCNGKMTRKHIQEFANITHEAQQFLVSCAERLSMSARSFDRIIRVARTIADLEEANSIHQHHIAEALHYRPSSNFVKT